MDKPSNTPLEYAITKKNDKNLRGQFKLKPNNVTCFSQQQQHLKLAHLIQPYHNAFVKKDALIQCQY